MWNREKRWKTKKGSRPLLKPSLRVRRAGALRDGAPTMALAVAGLPPPAGQSAAERRLRRPLPRPRKGKHRGLCRPPYRIAPHRLLGPAAWGCRGLAGARGTEWRTRCSGLFPSEGGGESMGVRGAAARPGLRMARGARPDTGGWWERGKRAE